MLPNNSSLSSPAQSGPAAPSPVEVEVKLPVADLPAILTRIRAAGYREIESRSFESNVLYDRDDQSLRLSRQALRLREYRGQSMLTFKGQPIPGPHKQREELETTVGSAKVIEAVFERLGYRPVFRYEKYRSVFQQEGQPGVITVDETPLGPYLELEGPPAWIDQTAQALGHGPDEYITDSYIALYTKDCQAKGIEPTHFVFSHRELGNSESPEQPATNG